MNTSGREPWPNYASDGGHLMLQVTVVIIIIIVVAALFILITPATTFANCRGLLIQRMIAASFGSEVFRLVTIPANNFAGGNTDAEQSHLEIG